jgi:hypothetical protein
VRRSHIFTSRRWRPEDGDPGHPERVAGVPVIERLATRPDAPGALVRLADRRYAITGRTLAAGLPRQLDRYIKRRARGSGGRHWYAEARRLLESRAGAEDTAETGRR